MSTETDSIFAAGLYNMLSGVKQDMARDEAMEAELVRTEGLNRLNTKINQENSPSGWVNKQTGKPIQQSELDAIPLDQRVTAGDFNIAQGKKQYEAGEQWRAPTRERERTEYVEDATRKDAARLALEGVKQKGLDRRKQVDEAAKQETARLRELKDTAKTKKDERDFKLKAAQVKAKYRDEYDEYVTMNTPGKESLLDKVKGRFGYGEDFPEILSFDNWLQEKDEDLFRIIGGVSDTPVKEKKKTTKKLSAARSFMNQVPGN